MKKGRSKEKGVKRQERRERKGEREDKNEEKRQAVCEQRKEKSLNNMSRVSNGGG